MQKQILYFLLMFYLFFLGSITLAQNKQKGGVPYGFLFPRISDKIVCSQFTPSLSIENLLQQDSKNDEKDGSPMRFAVSIPISLTVSVDDVMILENGLVVWQRRIISDGAQAMSLIFNEFVIPKNGKLFIYTPDGETTLGYFDHESSKYNKPFVTQFLDGDEVLVEYSEESSSLEDFASHASVTIDEIVYAYRGFNRFSKDVGDSGPCEVNINCPEGNNWQQQKRGVAKIYFKNGNNWYNCSGSLVNNTSNDGTSY